MSRCRQVVTRARDNAHRVVYSAKMQTHQPATPGPYPPARQSNPLGLAGFLFSLAGLVCSCGVLSPVALIISLVALRHPPRGLAVAGSVISAIGTLFIFICAGVGVWWAWQYQADRPLVNTRRALYHASGTLGLEMLKTRHVLDGQRGNRMIRHIRDGWGNSLRYEPKPQYLTAFGPLSIKQLDGAFIIRSAGPDGRFDTADDPYYEDKDPSDVLSEEIHNLPEPVLPQF